jgi:plastocyanin
MLRAGSAAILAAFCALGGGGPIAASATQRDSTITTVTVVMKEYRFALSRRSVPVGTVLFKIVNRGTIPHNMAFQGPIYKQSPLIQAGSSYRLRVVFKKPGTYVFLCTPHFELGMTGRLRVTRT